MKKYNRAFSLMMNRKFRFYNDLTYFNNCKMKIESYKKENSIEKMILTTNLKNIEDKNLQVFYTMEKKPNYNWHIVEIEIDGTKIKELFQGEFNQILSTKGVAGMMKYIEKQ